MYNEVTPSEPYDLMARESWVSDGSDVDTNEKRDNMLVFCFKHVLNTDPLTV